MDVVMLPLAWPSTTIAGALDLLKTYRRAGVVRHDPDDSYQLLFAGDLLRARAAGQTSLEDVQGGRAVTLVDAPIARKFQADLVRPRRTWEAYERLLDAHHTHYGLVREAAGVVLIVTRHEDETITLSVSGGFECTGTPTHYFPEPRVNIGDSCPLFPACRNSDGSGPAIRQA